ncbi:hypothetical protein [Parasitella parasitica]|uniref:Nudix hydrolase domain-containing protein n=1 Tax=Parasitella parasitica TaxID=35722 RepID=A0A0B7NR41_9FUNG|nr:hypothetical protein [Parasitella parasitica]
MRNSEFQPFKDWLQAFEKQQEDELDINSINIQNIDYFGFIEFKADVSFKDTDQKARMLKILLTLQPLIPIPHFNFPELPAGMLDGSGDFAGGAAKEIEEETVQR